MIEFAIAALVAAVVAFALVPLVLYVLGRRLPRAHVASRSVYVPSPPETVFAVIADVAAHPRWRKRVKRVKILRTEPRVHVRERGLDGTLELEVEESRAPERFVLRALPGRRAIFAGTWTFELASEDEGTRVTLTEAGEVSSPIARLFARHVLGEGANVERTLADLRSHFVSGASALPRGKDAR